MTLLEVKGLVAGYGSGPDILRGIDLTLEAGQIQCIIGPNGAGKSTLLKVICGILKPRDGDVIFEGESITRLRPDQVLRKGICFVPQERSLFPHMTVGENLRMGGYALKNARETQKRIKEIYRQFPILKQKRWQSANQLSGGQQQMLAMGRAMVLSPKIVLLDEPSLGLAPLIVEHIFEIVQQFKENGITVLMVEQNAHKGLEFADWGLVLDLGKNVFDGPANTILADPRIQELYLGTRQHHVHEETV